MKLLIVTNRPPRKHTLERRYVAMQGHSSATLLYCLAAEYPLYTALISRLIRSFTSSKNLYLGAYLTRVPNSLPCGHLTEGRYPVGPFKLSPLQRVQHVNGEYRIKMAYLVVTQQSFGGLQGNFYGYLSGSEPHPSDGGL